MGQYSLFKPLNELGNQPNPNGNEWFWLVGSSICWLVDLCRSSSSREDEVNKLDEQVFLFFSLVLVYCSKVARESGLLRVYCFVLLTHPPLLHLLPFEDSSFVRLIASHVSSVSFCMWNHSVVQLVDQRMLWYCVYICLTSIVTTCLLAYLYPNNYNNNYSLPFLVSLTIINQDNLPLPSPLKIYVQWTVWLIHTLRRKEATLTTTTTTTTTNYNSKWAINGQCWSYLSPSPPKRLIELMDWIIPFLPLVTGIVVIFITFSCRI